MLTETKIFGNFKPYTSYRNKKEEHRDGKPIIGAAIGAISGIALSKTAYKSLNSSIQFKKGLDKEAKIPFVEALDMITTAVLANVGGVIGGSKGASKESRERKVREAGFQIMNMSIPMILVTLALSTCNKFSKLNNNISRIIGSIIGMTSGAFIATKITNLTKEDSEPERKYTIKDSIANFDDVIATIKIGFSKIDKIIPVSKILPFIYTYSGARAGWKE